MTKRRPASRKTSASNRPAPVPDVQLWPVDGIGKVLRISGLDIRALHRARISRDPRFDGKFFIGVTSTRIYCRPICPVRSPKPDNIRYFPTAPAAAAAGYRPCLRCRPEAAPRSAAWVGTSAVVQRALRLIDAGALDADSVDSLAARVGLGPRHLHRLFMQHVGAPPLAVAHTRRLHFAKRLLDETSLPMSQIAVAAGFRSIRRFNDAFKRTYRRAPREVRRDVRRSHGAEAADEVILKLAFRPPYDWTHMLHFLAVRAVPGVERVDERGYARTVASNERAVIVCVRRIENCHALELRVRGADPAALLTLSSAARQAFDLAADPASIATAFRSDPLLTSLVENRPGLRIPGAWDPFECAVRVMLEQDMSVAAARTMVGRLVTRLGRPIANGSDGLTHLFPTPAALAAADLMEFDLAEARVEALRGLARALTDGRLEFGAPVDTIIKTLATLPGVGAWTAEYVALRALGEPDAMPACDRVLRHFRVGGDGPLVESLLEARAEAWRPWRGYAAFHLWQATNDAIGYRL